eukprot:2343304-Pyramimonas_sp.AAC.1
MRWAGNRTRTLPLGLRWGSPMGPRSVRRGLPNCAACGGQRQGWKEGGRGKFEGEAGRCVIQDKRAPAPHDVCGTQTHFGAHRLMPIPTTPCNEILFRSIPVDLHSIHLPTIHSPTQRNFFDTDEPPQ